MAILTEHIMQLSESLISRFIKAYIDEYGVVLSAEEAEAELLGLADLVELLQPKGRQNEY